MILDNQGRARTARTFILIAGAGLLLNTINIYFLVGLNPVYSVYLTGLISLIFLVSFILAAVFFLKWFRRAYANMSRAGYGNMAYKDGWAVGFWFIPLLNLYIPYQLLTETWEKSIKLLNYHNIDTSSFVAGKYVKLWWWLSWIGWNLLSFFDEAPAVIHIIMIVMASVSCYLMISKTSEIEKALFDNRHLFEYGNDTGADISEHFIDEKLV